jgi:hypothetical protein
MTPTPVRLVAAAVLVAFASVSPAGRAAPPATRPATRPVARPAGTTTISLTSPLDYQVYQRQTRARGTVVVAGSVGGPKDAAPPADARLEARLTGTPAGGGGGLPGDWEPLPFDPRVRRFRAELAVPAGGWYRLDVRLADGDRTLAESGVPRVGVGEVFVVAGQSNAANHGEERQRPASGLVSAFAGTGWRPADDPQPGATGAGGSFLPAFGDAVAGRFKVPVGLVDTAVGATSVREWLPRGTPMAGLPTLTGHVVTAGPGRWESDGELFDALAARQKALGPHGCRAILWHQGESDANQRDPERTLSGDRYRRYLEQVIRASREAAGWDCPWFVARATYHTPDEAASADVRAAQKALWDAGVALEGPDTDALGGEWRERGGRGVHFSGRGLREHGRLWADKVDPWLDRRLADPRE